MANVAAVPVDATSPQGDRATQLPHQNNPSTPSKAAVVPGGSFVGGGLTTGQIFPAGNK